LLLFVLWSSFSISSKGETPGFDPAHGQKSVFTGAGLLAYRRKVGTQKFIEMSEKLDKDEQRK
jgi:hypothetical protein